MNSEWGASHDCFGDWRFVSHLRCSGLESALFPALTGWVNLVGESGEETLRPRFKLRTWGALRIVLIGEWLRI